MSKVKAHIVIQTAFLGDLILSIPLLKKIKSLNPQQQLIVVCKKGLGDLLLKEKVADSVIEITKGQKNSYRDALTVLKTFEVQDVYCVHRSIRSLLFAAQIKAKRKIGFSSFLGFWIFDENVEYNSEWPEVLRILKILEPVHSSVAAELETSDWAYLNQADEAGHLPLVPEQFKFAAQLRVHKSSKLRIALFPGSVWATKKWTASGYKELAQFFLSRGHEVDLMGGPDEKALCEEIAKAAPQSQVLAGRLSISESLKAVAKYDLVICNDSASTHMAAYQHTPVVSIFGPTTLDLGFRPWTNESIIVENNQLNCRPCGKHGHQACPLGHHHCMEQITAAQVISAAQRMLPMI